MPHNKAFTLPPSGSLRRSSSGFALVIAISLVAFILLLLLSISTFVQIEQGTVRVSQEQLKAEQNALLGLNEALGKLQEALGPDQRTSATAAIFDQTPDTLTVNSATDGVKNPLWLAAMPTISTNLTSTELELENFNEANRSYALGYNTTSNLNGTAKPSSKELVWLVSMPDDKLNPTLSQYNPSIALDQEAADIAGGESNTVLLVQYTKSGSVELEARAGLVPINDPRNTEAGKYAWWIGDEGTKALINLPVQDTTLTNTNSEASSYQSPQVNNLQWLNNENLAQLSPEKGQPFSDNLGKLSTLTEVDLIDGLNSETQANLRVAHPELTTHSTSLQVDVVNGGLKRDLTAYLEGGQATFLDEMKIYPNKGDSFYTDSSLTFNESDGYAGAEYPLNFGDPSLATFGLFKSWYEIGQTVTGFDNGEVTPRAHDPAGGTHGLAPVIQRFGIWLQPLFEPDPLGGPAEIVYKIMPIVTLWNPHNVPLRANSYIMQFNAPPRLALVPYPGTTGPRSNIGAVLGTNEFELSSAINMRELIDHDNNDGISNINDQFRWFTFAVRDLDLMPGESRMLTTDPNQGRSYGSTGALHDYVNLDVNKFTSLSDLNGANLLSNENNDLSGFVIRLDANGNPTQLSSEADPTKGPLVGDILQARPSFYLNPATANSKSYSYKLHAWNGSRFEQVAFYDHREIGLAVADWRTHEHSMSVLDVYSVEDHLHEVDLDSIINQRHVSMCYGIINKMKDLPSIEHSKFDFNLRAGHVYIPEFYRNLMTTTHGSPGHNPSIAEYFLAGNTYNTVGENLQLAINSELLVYENSGYFPSESRPTVNGIRTQFDESGDGSLAIQIASLYDYQRGNEPLMSLGRFQHVQLGDNYWDVPHPFGNSRAHRMIPRNQLVRQPYTASPRDNDNNTLDSDNDFADLSYLANAALWDSFFLSTLPYGESADENTILPFQRNSIVEDFANGLPNDDILGTSGNGFNEAARYIQTKGALNINSTNKEAWRALLTAGLGNTVATGGVYGSAEEAHDISTEVAFPRLSHPPMHKDGDHPSYLENDLTKKASYVTSNPALDAESIDKLAEAIVEEVKRRGPFLSLSDFINRRIIPDSSDPQGDYLGLNGTIEAAINKVTQAAKAADESWGNGRYYQEFEDPLGFFEGQELVFWNNDLREHYTGLPENEETSIYKGAPAWLTQADVLSAIGPALTARSDTFTIRAYGETTNAFTGEPEAKAWCEAVVQRTVEPVDPSDTATVAGIINPKGNAGRRFTVKSFRWLDESEVSTELN